MGVCSDCVAINHLSLCAGIGGIDLGLRAVVEGCRTIAYVEIEAFAIAHLVAQMEAGRLDSAPIFTDLQSSCFPWGRFAGLVDIVSGGFPCQPFSHAGTQASVDDPRHLWPTIARGLDVIRPACVFFENVDGIASAKSPGYHSVLHHVLCDLEALGFRTTAGCFTASEVGAPHLRKRWFILGLADSDRFGQRKRSKTHHTNWGNAPRNNTCGCNAGVADGDSSRRKQQRWPVATSSQHATTERGRWPAGPGQPQHEWEHPRTIEPGMGGATNGLSFRVDRLRALGNAVVPVVAARAFVELWGRLNQTDDGGA